MTVVAFVLLAGLAVGAVADLHGLILAVAGVFIGAGVAVLLDVAGILWRTWRAVWAGRVPGHLVRHSAPDGPNIGILPRVLWLMMRDTFELSAVMIGLVGGLTYMVLVMLAWSRHLALN